MCIVWLYHTCFFSEAMLYCHAMQHIGTRQRGHQPGKPGNCWEVREFKVVRENSTSQGKCVLTVGVPHCQL